MSQACCPGKQFSALLRSYLREPLLLARPQKGWEVVHESGVQVPNRASCEICHLRRFSDRFSWALSSALHFRASLTGCVAVVSIALEVTRFGGLSHFVFAFLLYKLVYLTQRYGVSHLPKFALLRDVRFPQDFAHTIVFLPVRRTLPNPTHFALAALQHAGVVGPLITQKVDGLHHAALRHALSKAEVDTSILELHGSESFLAAVPTSLVEGLFR
jgi:hypothetical protein